MHLGTQIERGQSAPTSKSSPELSPEVHNHYQVAAAAAKEASAAFLIGNGKHSVWYHRKCIIKLDKDACIVYHYTRYLYMNG